MVVKAEGGALVRLQDVATVELGAAEHDTSVQMNGQHAVFIGINATPDRQPARRSSRACGRCCRPSSAACRRR